MQRKIRCSCLASGKRRDILAPIAQDSVSLRIMQLLMALWKSMIATSAGGGCGRPVTTMWRQYRRRARHGCPRCWYWRSPRFMDWFELLTLLISNHPFSAADANFIPSSGEIAKRKRGNLNIRRKAVAQFLKTASAEFGTKTERNNCNYKSKRFMFLYLKNRIDYLDWHFYMTNTEKVIGKVSKAQRSNISIA